jgi:hypothetical protein
MKTRNEKTGLGKALRLFRRRRYTETIRFLEPQVFTYRENAAFYYLLGIACLHTGDFAGAYSYLKRSLQLEPHHTEALLGLAVVHLRRRETSESLRIWLEVLDENPKNVVAKRGLNFLKTNSNPEIIDAYLESPKIHGLIASPGFYIPPGVKIFFYALLLLGLLVPLGLGVKTRLFLPKEYNRPEISEVFIGQDESLVDTGEKFTHMFSDKEIRTIFSRIKDLFEGYEDNLARKEINRLLLSNAGKSIKEKIRLFLPHIKAPDFVTLKESFTFQEVIKEPALHEGCFVRWKGRVSNIKAGEKEITFDFLVGYHDQKVLEGIIPARMDFAAKLDPAFAYEIIGKILLRGEKSFGLSIVSLRELGL